MVLAELGARITDALKNLNSVTVIDTKALDECLKEISAALLHSDVNVKYVMEMRNNIKKIVNIQELASGTNKRKIIQKGVFNELIRMLTADKDPYQLKKGKPNVIMFVGLQGSGKTTTCGKFAHWYHRKGWKAALVCADTFRAGAFDQLKQNATKARIPFYGSYTESDPVKIAQEGVDQFKKEGYDLIIVDTSGRHSQESALFDEMKQVAEAIDPQDVVFVMDSHIGQACYDQAKAFRSSINVGSVIVTKLDGHAKGGGALSAVSATGAPIIFVGSGEHLDDFDAFNPKSFVSRLLGMGDLSGLFATIQDVVPLDKQPQMMNRLSQGLFTLRDMGDQFQNVLKIGPIGKMMSMIPGFDQGLIPKGSEQEGVKRVKRFMTMLDSMTDAELDCEKPMVASRVFRVAKGSGHTVAQVTELLDEFKKFSKLVGNMGKMGLTKGNDMQQLMRNPSQVMQRLHQSVDPKMLKQMGGAQGMMNLMKEIGKNENMMDFMGEGKK
eukprot:GHVL01010940.1.p1 GENE.GHVL01010940.1~~GHVL01010940.1.p1  ORF type:complete len:496 (+),score=88.47 GHVL01010940.1:140-1627(+)